MVSATDLDFLVALRLACDGRIFVYSTLLVAIQGRLMQEAIGKLIKWVDEQEIPLRDGKTPTWVKTLIDLIAVSTAIATLITGDIWLKVIIYIFLFGWLIKTRKRIKMLYLTKIRYNTRRIHIRHAIGVLFLLISLQILGKLGFFNGVGHLWVLLKDSFVDVVNVSRGLDASSSYGRSIAILLLTSFGIFALQLIMSPSQRDEKTYLLNLYINKSHKYEWSYFLNWLKDKDWDLICGNSVRVVGRNNDLVNVSIRELVQNRERKNFPEVKSALILEASDCRLGCFERGRLKLEIYPPELIMFFIKNKKLLEASLNHFICQEILGIESILIWENENGLLTEAFDYEFLREIDLLVADFPLKPKLQTSME